MRRHAWRRFAPWSLGLMMGSALFAEPPLSWDQVRERCEKNNPNLQAGELLIHEARADQITAGLRPNPVFSSINDQFLFFNTDKFKPFGTSQWTESVTQLLERRRKRPLRIESARLGTAIAASDQLDLKRQLLFELRDAFVRTLQAKALVDLARENLAHYDKVLEVNRRRFQAGDIAQVDLTRLELQRAQFESDLVNASVNLRTAKIALLALMNERQPVDAFDVEGDFAYHEPAITLDDARHSALDARPDLKSAAQAIDKARTDNKLAWANGSTDPDFYLEYQRTQSDNTMGFGVTIPLRIFDRNQGEKARTEIEITRAERNRQAVTAAILRDVDSAFATLSSVRDLILPYRDRYIPQARDIRETVSFSYSRGGATLLDFLDAQKSYRDTQVAYQNLIGNYYSALNQLNLATGTEVSR